MWFIGVEVERETSAPPSKKNPGSAPVILGGSVGSKKKINLKKKSLEVSDVKS